MNSQRANPDKTQVPAFHLGNKVANRSLKVVWNETEIENTTHPKYLDVTLDKSFSYKHHIQNENEGGYLQQPTEEISNFPVGSKSNYYQKDMFSIDLLYG